MTYKKTVLNVCSGVFIAGCLLDIIIEYDKLSYGEGWGVVSMIGLIGVGFLTLFIDLLLQRFIKSGTVLNVLGTLTVIIFAILITKDL
jgi:hypothetical protein